MSALDEMLDKRNWRIFTQVIGSRTYGTAEYLSNPPPIEEAAAELAALRARVGAYHKQIAEVNELLWEFTENPNIELGEKGFSKIEDYFKKYSKTKARNTKPLRGQKRIR